MLTDSVLANRHRSTYNTHTHVLQRFEFQPIRLWLTIHTHLFNQPESDLTNTSPYQPIRIRFMFHTHPPTDQSEFDSHTLPRIPPITDITRPPLPTNQNLIYALYTHPNNQSECALPPLVNITAPYLVQPNTVQMMFSVQLRCSTRLTSKQLRQRWPVTILSPQRIQIDDLEQD